jgi:uncharacterized membrane protein
MLTLKLSVAMIRIMLLAIVVASLSVHLGLSEAVGKVIYKIIRCPQCLSCWLTFAATMYYGADILFAMTLSLLAAFLSNWMIFLFIGLTKLYNVLWERLNKENKKKR